MDLVVAFISHTLDTIPFSNMTFIMEYFEQYSGRVADNSPQINSDCLVFVGIQWNYTKYVMFRMVRDGWMDGSINTLPNSIDTIRFSVNLIAK